MWPGNASVAGHTGLGPQCTAQVQGSEAPHLELTPAWGSLEHPSTERSDRGPALPAFRVSSGQRSCTSKPRGRASPDTRPCGLHTTEGGCRLPEGRRRSRVWLTRSDFQLLLEDRVGAPFTVLEPLPSASTRPHWSHGAVHSSLILKPYFLNCPSNAPTFLAATWSDRVGSRRKF